MLRVYHCGDASELLCLGDGMDCQGGFTARLGAVDFHYAAARITADSQGMVQGNAAAGDNLGVAPFWLVSQLHDRTFSIIFFDFVDRGLKRLQLGGVQYLFFFCFVSHNKSF